MSHAMFARFDEFWGERDVKFRDDLQLPGFYFKHKISAFDDRSSLAENGHPQAVGGAHKPASPPSFAWATTSDSIFSHDVCQGA